MLGKLQKSRSTVRAVYASERIQAAGFVTFLPMLQTKRASAPLFPGYLFTFVIEQWRVLNTTFGVLTVVRTGDCPCRMPDAEIDRLKAMTVGGFVRLREHRPKRRGVCSRRATKSPSSAALCKVWRRCIRDCRPGRKRSCSSPCWARNGISPCRRASSFRRSERTDHGPGGAAQAARGSGRGAGLA
jgi:hypothetical protein